MTNQTLSVLSEKYLSLVEAENCGALNEEESNDRMTDCLMEAGIEWDDFIEYLEDKGII